MAMAPFRNAHAYTETNSPTSNCGDASKGKADPTATSCSISVTTPGHNTNPKSKKLTIPNASTSERHSLQHNMKKKTTTKKPLSKLKPVK